MGMGKYDMTVKTDMISDKDLPDIITGQVKKLDALSKSVDRAMQAAESAKESAKNARNQSADMFKKKSAIEGLQSAGADLADAVEAGAEAQKLSFEFQTKLAEITSYLFKLGTLNIASNRSVVRELELRLSGASKEKLSQFAKQELLSVVKQLKDQEDVMKKQEDMRKIVKFHDEKIKIQDGTNIEFQSLIDAQDEVDKKHAEELKLQAEMNRMLDEKVKAQDEVDKVHSKQISLQAEMDKILDEKIRAQDEVDKMHSEQIRLQAEMDKMLDEKIKAQDEVDKMHSEQIRLQAEMDKMLEEKIQAQDEVDKIHTEQIENLNKILTIHEKTIDALKEDIRVKANAKLVMISLVVASISVVISIISMIN